nr:protein kinase [Mycoplasmopsis bovis]
MAQLFQLSAINYVRQICEAMQELHSNNIIHRDIKSNNIIVTSRNHIKILRLWPIT